MSEESLIKKFLKRFREIFPGAEEGLEKELIPLRPEEEVQPRLVKRRKKKK